VWTGRDALAKGLVDKLGGFPDALALACEKGGLTGKEGEAYHVVEYPKRKGPLEFLEQMFGGDETAVELTAILGRIPELRKVLAHIQTLRAVSKDGVSVMHPELSGFFRPFEGGR
jgi:protease-4